MTLADDLELRDNPLPDDQPDALAELLGDQEVREHYHPTPLPPPPPAPPPLDVVLADLDEVARPKHLPACATCPAALWRVRQLPAHGEQPATGFDCYCQIMHQFTFDTSNPVAFVKECGGRLQALAEREARPAHELDSAPNPKNQP